MQDNLPSVLFVGWDSVDIPFMKSSLLGLASTESQELTLQDAMPHIKNNPHAIVLLFFDNYPEVVLDFTRKLSTLLDVTVVIVSKKQDPQNILLAMKAGAKDFAFIEQDNAEDVKRAIFELGLIKKKIEEAKKGEIISIFGAKGGSGATTIAANLAGGLLSLGLDKKDKNRKVLLLDFDMAMGDVSVFLDIDIVYSYEDLIENMYRLDAELLYQSLTVHSSGLFVVAPNNSLGEVDGVSSANLSKILNFLKPYFDFIVIDGIRDFGETSLVALDNSDYIAVTMTPDIPSLKNASRCLSIFKKLNYQDDKIFLVLNRYNKAAKITSDSISDALGKNVMSTIRNNFPQIIESINHGDIVIQQAPRSKIAKDIFQFGGLFVDTPVVKKRSFLPFRRD